MLIGLNGRKQAGKDTVFQRAAHIMADVVLVERVSFADLLYRSAAAALGVTPDELGRWKNDPEMLVAVGSYYSGDLGFLPVGAPITVREYLQRYGTEAHRDIFSDDFWVEQVGLTSWGHADRIVMVTDCRFPNEARAVRAAGGHVVTVVGPGDVEDSGDGHASEAPLPYDLVDVTLFNDVRDDGFATLDERVGSLLRCLMQRQDRDAVAGIREAGL